MPFLSTTGAASARAFGFGGSLPPLVQDFPQVNDGSGAVGFTGTASKPAGYLFCQVEIIGQGGEGANDEGTPIAPGGVGGMYVLAVADVSAVSALYYQMDVNSSGTDRGGLVRLTNSGGTIVARAVQNNLGSSVGDIKHAGNAPSGATGGLAGGYTTPGSGLKDGDATTYGLGGTGSFGAPGYLRLTWLFAAP